MLLTVDVGNTQTHFGTWESDTLGEHWRFATVRDSTADELGAALRNLVELRGIGLADLDASIVSSTVPQLGPAWVAMAERHGLRPVEPLRLTCRDKAVRWERVDLDFTFINLVLAKDGGRRWLPWGKPRSRPSTADAASDR